MCPEMGRVVVVRSMLVGRDLLGFGRFWASDLDARGADVGFATESGKTREEVLVEQKKSQEQNWDEGSVKKLLRHRKTAQKGLQ